TKLTTEQRAQAILMIERGFASREIAAKIGCKSHITILNLKKKYEKTSKVEDKQRSGQPRKLNERNERTIIRRLMTNECSNAVQLKKSLQINDEINVSSNTVRRALKRN
ncbi:12531_t:CDS:1, partial [Rhizophagus irregularis]